MNKRIEKLIDDAKLTAVCEMFEDELVQFAESIIRECAEKVEDLKDHRIPASEYADNLREHFGVK
jgi:hypothetical protein